MQNDEFLNKLLTLFNTEFDVSIFFDRDTKITFVFRRMHLRRYIIKYSVGVSTTATGIYFLEICSDLLKNLHIF